MLSYDQPHYDAEMLRLWGLVAELSEQLNQTRGFIASLRNQASEIKAQALHSGTGFALRRFNMDMSQEDFDAELVRMSALLSQENASLQNDSKQLSLLLKEYEQAVESVMSSFRTQAHASQTAELSMTRFYEQLLANRDGEIAAHHLLANATISRSLARISQLLRDTVRAANGEGPRKEEEAGKREGRGYTTPAISLSDEDWSLERECELVRLEKENEDLRRLLGLGLDGEKEDLVARRIVAARNPQRRMRNAIIGGAAPMGYVPQGMSPSGWSEHDLWQQHVRRGYPL